MRKRLRKALGRPSILIEPRVGSAPPGLVLFGLLAKTLKVLDRYISVNNNESK
jgi:hypothetical protein